MPSILQPLELPLRCNDRFDELSLGRVLELEIEALDCRVVCGEFLSQLQMEDGVASKALQVIEDDHIVLSMTLHETEHGNHARTLHEVATAGDVITENGINLVSTGGCILAAAMLLAVQAVAVVLLLLVGDPTIDDGSFLLGRINHEQSSSDSWSPAVGRGAYRPQRLP
ncbi:MAG TPA: hypothetical protein VFX89_22950 [Gammaproteobacteria bacterium]|nr:hypothetical protein [Gammaproteobacteria bacterium]